MDPRYHYPQQSYQNHQYTQPDPNFSSGAADSIHDAQRLLGSTPFASATPVNHGAHYLSNFSTTANPPSYSHPQYYTPTGPSHQQAHHQGYPGYYREYQYLQQHQAPVNDGGYWQSTRDQAVGLLGPSDASAYAQYSGHSQYDAPPRSSSSYRTNAFAHSVFQRIAPATAYPTPPPPEQTYTSSLAGALDEVPPRPRNAVHRPEGSTRTFETFLNAQTRTLGNYLRTQRPRTPPPAPLQAPAIVVQPISPRRHVAPATGPPRFHSDIRSMNSFEDVQLPPIFTVEATTQSQPFPSTLSSPYTRQIAEAAMPKRSKHRERSTNSPDSLAPLPEPTVVTPRKRKPEGQLNSPSIKRLHGEPGSTSIISSGSSASSVLAREFDEKANLTPTLPSRKKEKKHSQPFSRQMVYVELPPMKHSTTSSDKLGNPNTTNDAAVFTPTVTKMSKRDVEDDSGGVGTEYDSHLESPTRKPSNLVPTSAKKTGERDLRQPLEKLLSLLDDVFEAEDSLPADASLADLPVDYFSSLSVDQNLPLLQFSVLRKLLQSIAHVARPSKKIRLSSHRDTHGGTPYGKGRMAEVDPDTLSRAFKLLERSVKAGDDIDPFQWDKIEPLTSNQAMRKSVSPTKKSKTKKSAASAPEQDVVGQDNTSNHSDHVDAKVSEVDLYQLSQQLELATGSILAADCCLALLASDRLPKQLYSEELILTCLATVKSHLARIIYPFVEAFSLSCLSPLLRYIMKSDASSPLAVKDCRKQLLEVFTALSAALPRIGAMVTADVMTMSESIVIQAVYIAIGPFFVVDGDSDGKAKKDNVVAGTLGASAMRSLRLDALSLIRAIFANYEDQRSWIVEEILSSLIKLSDNKQKTGQFRLRDGRSIRTVSALLLQLIQTSAHDVRTQAQRLAKVRQQKLALRRQDSLVSTQGLVDEVLLDDQDFEEVRLYASGLKSATDVAKSILLFLTQRSGKTKTTKNSNEAEYRAIFDHLISDIMVVLFWPEWPAASLLLGVICKFMIASLDDVRSSNNDNNAAKSVALDHLGLIAARLKAGVLSSSKNNNAQPERKPLLPLEEILIRRQADELNALDTAYREIFAHLCKRASEGQASESARELHAVIWGQQVAHALQRVNAVVNADNDSKPILAREKAGEMAPRLKAILQELWKEPTTDVFGVGSQDDITGLQQLSEEVACTQHLRTMIGPILNVILLSLDAPPVFMRTKALRALGQILVSDPSTLKAPNVRAAIESHLLDSSPAVRDAAVELIGKYMIESPEIASSYYQKIADRIADTGLGVRKRVIKLLKSYHDLVEDNGKRIDICTRIVLRMYDEDDGVKDLAIKTIEELWFHDSGSMPKNRASRGHPAESQALEDNAKLHAKVAVIMGVCTNFKDRQSPLEDMLSKIMADKADNDAAQLLQMYSQICETLIDGLVDDSDIPGFTIVNAVRTIHLFAVAYPAVLSGSNASTLLPYVKNAKTLDEHVTSEYLLKIFRACVPHMPKTAAKFGQDLQIALQPMILKPQTGLGGLQESVACMCFVVQNLTHDHKLLVGLLKSCDGRLQQFVKKQGDSMTDNDLRVLSMLVFIVSLLGQHCDFDHLRQEEISLASEVNAVSRGSIVEHIYDSLLDLYDRYQNPTFKRRILHCLGFLFRARPTLMTVESSAAMMDAIFRSPDEEDHGRLLSIMQEFLLSQVSKVVEQQKGGKRSAKDKSVNMDELIGDADNFADSGVSLAVVQRYIDHIIKAALSRNVHIQAAAVDILSFTVRQGLAHPMQCFPTLVALETTPNAGLSNRAHALHGILHNKHTSVLNARQLSCFMESFTYQKSLAEGNVVHGFQMPGPTALLHRWYSLVREKRTQRQDFLRATVKAFELKQDMQTSLDDVHYIRYVAENFSAFDYKTQEEVLTVIKHLTSVLSTTGTQLLDKVSPSNLLEQLADGSQQEMAATEQQVVDTADDRLGLMRSTVIIAIFMVLRSYLKTVYSLSEEKCSKWVQGKKSAVGDRLATRKHEEPINWDRLSFATVPLITTEHVESQKKQFLDIWSQEGVSAEPIDDEDAT